MLLIFLIVKKIDLYQSCGHSWAFQICWHIECSTFSFLDSRITVDCDCSHGIKRHLPFGRKAVTNLDSRLKSRDITLPTKVHLDKAMVFPVVMRVGPWRALKNCSFWTVVLEKTLESPWDCKEIKPVNPEEINPKYSLEGLMLKLKLQYFGHLMRKANSLEKTLMPGKIEGKRSRDSTGWDGWMASLMQWTWFWANCGRWWRTGKPGVLQSMGSQRVRHDWATELTVYP